MLLSSISLLKMGNIQNMIQPSGHTVSRLPRERERELYVKKWFIRRLWERLMEEKHGIKSCLIKI